MMEVLVSIHDSGLGTWVRESESLWAYPTILFLHTVGMAFLVGMSVAVNLRILASDQDTPLAPMEKFFPVMYFGFLVASNVKTNLCSVFPVLTVSVLSLMVAEDFSFSLSSL